MGDVVKSKRNSVKTTWNFCCMGRKGKKAKLEDHSIVFILDFVGGKKWKRPLKIWNY